MDMKNTEATTAVIVTVGAGHNTHIISRNDPSRTWCGLTWTDEFPVWTRVTCAKCRKVR